MIILTSLAAALAADLTVTGSCPGTMTLTATGLTPFGTWHVITSNGIGDKVLSAGACPGLNTGLSPNGLKKRSSGVADAYGVAVLTPTLGMSACGAKIMVMDEATCTASPARWMAEATTNHLSAAFDATAFNGQWCDTDAPVNYQYFGEMDFDSCDALANATGTQWYVGQWTDFTDGWIGDQDATFAAASNAFDWPNETLVARTTPRSCVLGQIEHRTEPTVSPGETLFTDAAGRVWHYWSIAGQTHSQAMAFADMKGARIINPNSVGLGGLARMTAPTHWCHAGAQFNGASSCNSDNICDFIVGYYE